MVDEAARFSVASGERTRSAFIGLSEDAGLNWAAAASGSRTVAGYAIPIGSALAVAKQVTVTLAGGPAA